jgi:signal transduction histidine kinase
MINEKPSQSEKETAPPRLGEVRRILEDYANDVRAIIKRLRQKLH